MKKNTCAYCGSPLKDTDLTCPGCGAPNPDYQEAAAPAAEEAVPRTIEELRAFCERHNLPLSQMRFFLGENYQGPKAFGIYQDASGKFVVYKNKADGSRAIRYEGYDEAYAVNELYEKMHQEVMARKAYKSASNGSMGTTSRGNIAFPNRTLIIGVIAAIVIIAGLVFGKSERHNGYYQYDDSYYYRQGSDWYTYDSGSGWLPVILDTGSELMTNDDDYWLGSSYDSGYDASDFSDSSFYVEEDHSDSDWDWDSGDSWDSDFTDWDSDW